MPLKIQSSTLAAALKGAKDVVESRNVIPILSMVRLTAIDGGLNILTTNLDIEYNQTVKLDTPGDLAVCVDARRLFDMASAANGVISIDHEPDNRRLVIKCGRSRWVMPTLPTEDFPVMSVDKLCKPMPFASEDLATVIRRVVWAASDEQVRYYLSGIFLNQENKAARFVATDGTGLASITTDVKWPKDAPDVIIPKSLLSIVSAACGSTASVALSWDANKMRFEFPGEDGAITITGKMIEGNYPDYRRVIPSATDSAGAIVAINSDDLIGAVKRVRIASDAKEKKLRISRKDDVLLVRVEGTSGFEGVDEVPASCIAGFESGVNADYLVNVVSAAESENIIIDHADALVAMRFTSPTDDAFVGVVMAMRI